MVPKFTGPNCTEPAKLIAVEMIKAKNIETSIRVISVDPCVQQYYWKND